MNFNNIISMLTIGVIGLFPYKAECPTCLCTIDNVKIISEAQKIDETIISDYNIDKIKDESKKLNDYDVNLISRVVMAEAEGEPLEGKRYVIDTILNRVDSVHFPNTVEEVIFQKDQFTSVWNGRYDRCESNEELNELIQKEYIDRTNNDIVFFTADKYGEYGTPSFYIGNHYFSNY